MSSAAAALADDRQEGSSQAAGDADSTDCLQRTVVADGLIERRLVYTLHCMQHLRRPHVQQSSKLDLLAAADWDLLDVSFASTDGDSLPSILLALLRELKPAPDTKGKLAKLHPLLLRQLQSYRPSDTQGQRSDAAHVPKDADELLLRFALELSAADLGLLWPLLEQLLKALHARGVDLDQRDAEGRTLLTQYAARCDRPEGVALVQLLLRLGACAWVASAQGHTLLTAWTQLELKDLMHSALREVSPWQGMRVQLAPWQRQANGQRLLELALAKGQTWALVAEFARELQRHWEAHTRPLLMRCVTEYAQLIPDVAHMVLSYVDGEERPSEAQ